MGEDGERRRSLRSSEPEFREGEPPSVAGLLWARSCSWTCELLAAVEKEQRLRDTEDLEVSEGLRVRRKIGDAVLKAIQRAGDEPATFVTPIGAFQVQVQVSLEGLSQPAADDRRVLHVLELFREARERVAARWRCRDFSGGAAGPE